MSIDADIFKRVGVDEEKDERARRAVKAFRALQPTLTSYARALTKRSDVRVEMAARDNGSTDGTKIYFRPPIAMGDATPHNRALCDKRDDELQLLCEACAIREHVLTTIYHEIAHICYDSFAATTPEDQAEAIKAAVKERGTKYAAAIEKRIKTAPPYVTKSFIGLAGLISEFLPIIVNALEDARVNRELFKARKGTKIMFDADTHKIFRDGVEQKDADGNIIVKKWTEYPLNMQVIVGLFCKGSNYDYSTFFVPKVVAALDDEELTSIVRLLDTTRSARGVYSLSFLALDRLRQLGFCLTDEDPEDAQPEAQPKPQAEEPDEPVFESEPQPSQEDESSDDEPESGDDSSEDSSSSGDDQSDPEPGDSADEGADSNGSDDDESEDGSDSEDGEDGSPESESSDGDDESPDGGDSQDEPGNASEGEEVEPDGDSTEGRESGDAGSPESVEPTDDSDADDRGGQSGTASGDQRPGEDSSPGGDDDLDSASDLVESDGADDSGSVEQRDLGGSEGVDTVGDDGEPDGEADDSPSSSGVESSGDEGDSEEAPDELIDTGADDGRGGTEVVENEANDDLPMGSAEECKAGLAKWGDHEEKPAKAVEADLEDQDAVDRAIIQGLYFETGSRNIYGVREHRFGQPIFADGENMSQAWDHSLYTTIGYTRRSLGIEGDFSTPESILGPALLRMRVAFADNQRGHELRNMKSGKVDGRVLGKRAHHGDERLFRRRVLPGKRDYFVLIGMDVSGSTVGENISLEKRAVFAQANLLSRMGIKFAIYAHSGNMHSPDSGRKGGIDLDIYFIKEPNEVWDQNIQARLTTLGPDAANLDGHTLEYYRKVLDRETATDKIILYYTDGKMPAENHDEELEILRREIRICKQKNYTLLGVGIRTDSPVRHGLDTVQVDEESDVVKVVRHLEKRLLKR